MSAQERDGRIVTFYSYKGGTGRSMLLANVAWILASKGKRVLMIDWDLEAPGLHRYFHPFLADKYMRTTPGLVDWVVEYQKAVSALPEGTKSVPKELLEEHADLTSYLISLDLDAFALQGMGSLHLVTAGRQDEAYPTRVNRFDWQHLYQNLGGFEFFQALRSWLEKQYDYVLIDSRTGVSDTAGLCTLEMPDTLVVCFTLNSQSIMGASSVARDVLNSRAKAQSSGERHPFRAFPVPTRIERGEKAKVDATRRTAREQFKDFPTSLSGAPAERYWGRVEVPYESFYAFEEILAVFADRRGDVNSLLGSAERLTDYLTDHKIDEVGDLPDSTRMRICEKYTGSGANTIDFSQAAEAVVAKLRPEDDAAAQILFLRFIYADATGITSLMPVSDSDVPARCSSLLNRFLAEGIIVRRDGLVSGVSWLALLDPDLLNTWRRLANWVLEDRQFIAWRTNLAVNANTWHAAGRDPSFLIEGRELEAANSRSQERINELAQLEIDYLMASRIEEEAGRQRQADQTAGTQEVLARQAALIEGMKDAQAILNLQGATSKSRFRTFLARYPVSVVIAGILLVLAAAAGGWFFVPQIRELTVTLTAPSANQVGQADLAAAKTLIDGQSKADAGNYEAAVKVFGDAIKENPNSRLAYYRRALAYEKLKRYQPELADLNAALAFQTGGSDPEAYFHRGTALYNLALYDRSVADLSETIKLSPEYERAFFWRGCAYFQSQRYLLAKNDFDEAIKLNPKQADAYAWLGELLDQKLDKHPEAIEAYTKAIGLDPSVAWYWEDRGGTYNNMGNPELALKDLDEAIERDKTAASAYSKRGYAYHLLGQSKNALSDYDEAIKLDPKWVFTYTDRAVEREKMGDKNGAAADRALAAKLKLSQ